MLKRKDISFKNITKSKEGKIFYNNFLSNKAKKWLIDELSELIVNSNKPQLLLYSISRLPLAKKGIVFLELYNIIKNLVNDMDIVTLYYTPQTLPPKSGENTLIVDYSEPLALLQMGEFYIIFEKHKIAGVDDKKFALEYLKNPSSDVIERIENAKTKQSLRKIITDNLTGISSSSSKQSGGFQFTIDELNREQCEKKANYTVNDKISKGIQGSVSEVCAIKENDPNCDRYAVKVYTHNEVEYYTQADSKESFSREVKALLYLQEFDLATPKIYDAWNCKDESYIIMDRFSGATLETLLDYDEVTDDEMRDLARTVVLMHSLPNPVIHHDLHLKNVVYHYPSEDEDEDEEGGRFHIIDFGKSEILDNEEVDEDSKFKKIFQDQRRLYNGVRVYDEFLAEILAEEWGEEFQKKISKTFLQIGGRDCNTLKPEIIRRACQQLKTAKQTVTKMAKNFAQKNKERHERYRKNIGTVKENVLKNILKNLTKYKGSGRRLDLNKFWAKTCNSNPEWWNTLFCAFANNNPLAKLIMGMRFTIPPNRNEHVLKYLYAHAPEEILDAWFSKIKRGDLVTWADFPQYQGKIKTAIYNKLINIPEKFLNDNGLSIEPKFSKKILRELSEIDRNIAESAEQCENEEDEYTCLLNKLPPQTKLNEYYENQRKRQDIETPELKIDLNKFYVEKCTLSTEWKDSLFCYLGKDESGQQIAQILGKLQFVVPDVKENHVIIKILNIMNDYFTEPESDKSWGDWFSVAQWKKWGLNEFIKAVIRRQFSSVVYKINNREPVRWEDLFNVLTFAGMNFLPFVYGPINNAIDELGLEFAVDEGDLE